MLKHTPGPWEELGNSVVDSDGKIIAYNILNEDDMKLIAESPNLLHAAKQTIQAIKVAMKLAERVGDHKAKEDFEDDLKLLIRVVGRCG